MPKFKPGDFIYEDTLAPLWKFGVVVEDPGIEEVPPGSVWVRWWRESGSLEFRQMFMEPAAACRARHCTGEEAAALKEAYVRWMVRKAAGTVSPDR